MRREFTQHGARNRGLVVGLSVVLVLEAAVIHVMVREAPWWVHAFLVVTNVSVLSFLLRHDRAIERRPIVVGDGTILVQHGLLLAATVPLTSVAEVASAGWRDVPGEFSRGYLKASGFDDPNVVVTLRDAVRVRLGFGMHRTARVIGLRVDDPASFVACINASLAAPASPS